MCHHSNFIDDVTTPENRKGCYVDAGICGTGQDSPLLQQDLFHLPSTSTSFYKEECQESFKSESPSNPSSLPPCNSPSRPSSSSDFQLTGITLSLDEDDIILNSEEPLPPSPPPAGCPMTNFFPGNWLPKEPKSETPSASSSSSPKLASNLAKNPSWGPNSNSTPTSPPRINRISTFPFLDPSNSTQPSSSPSTVSSDWRQRDLTSPELEPNYPKYLPHPRRPDADTGIWYSHIDQSSPYHSGDFNYNPKPRKWIARPELNEVHASIIPPRQRSRLH